MNQNKNRYPVLALHGFLGQGQDWNPILLNHCCFRAPDLFTPGPLQLGHKFDEWISRLSQYDFVNERPWLVGYSMGGRLAAAAYLKYPEKYSGLVLVSANIEPLSKAERIQRKNNDRQWAQLMDQLSWQDWLNKWNGQSVFLGSRQPDRCFLPEQIPILQSALKNFGLADQPQVDWGLLAEYKSRVYFCVGEKDIKYRKIYQGLVNSQKIENFQIISGAGHRVLLDQPEGLRRHLLELFKKH